MASMRGCSETTGPVADPTKNSGMKNKEVEDGKG
jgi:hypothetical protein